MVMLGQVTMQEVIVDALGKHGRIVILSDDLRNDDLSAACEIAGGSLVQSGNRRFTRKTTSLRRGRRRAAPPWIIAALLAATWVSETQAAPEARHAQADGLVIAAHAVAARNVVFGGAAGDPDIGRVQASRFGDRSMRFAQAATGGTENSQKALEQQRDQQKAADGGAAECKSFKDDRASRLEQDLAAARGAIDTQTALAAKANDEVARLRQEAENGAGELQSFLQQERDRAVRLEQDLAAARRGVDTQTALAAKVSYEAARLKRALESGAGELQESLKQERDRAERFEQDLAAARRDVETQTALAAKASAEAAQSTQAAASDGSDLQKSLQQEHARAERLEQDLAAARRDVETQTALAAKASAEAAQSKQAAASGGSDLQKSLQQERARADRLEQDLAAARRDVETKTALVIKASDVAARAKQAAESSVGDLQKSLQKEHARAGQLEQDLAVARRDVETQTALVTKAGAEAARVKQTSESSAGDLQKSLQQEHARADRLEQDLAAARRDVETQTALVTKAGAEAARVKQASESGAGDLQKSLQQERARAGQLEQDLAAARRDVETQTALATKANDETARMKQAAESGAGDLQKSLQQEFARAGQLERDLAAARRDVETMSVLVIKVSAAAARAKQAAESSAGNLQKSVQQEHARASQLEQDLAAARRDVETKTVLMMKASAAAARGKRAAESSAGDLQKSLQQERDRADRLEQDLAAAQRDVETKTALVIKASEAVARTKQAVESDAGDLQKSLQQEHARANRLEQDLAAARRDLETRTELVIKASAVAARAKQEAESGAGDLQKSLEQEHARADQLEQDLAAARRDAESKTALAAKASDEAARVKQAAQRIVGELQKSLQQERDQRERLERNLASAEHAKDAPVPPEGIAVAKPND